MSEIGHNAPPIEAQLETDHADLLARHAALIDSGTRVPETLDDESAPKMTQFIKQLTEFEKRSENCRTAAKRPILDTGRAIDKWFKRYQESIAELKARCTGRLTKFQRAVAAAERAARKKAEQEARAAAQAAREREEAEAKAAAEAAAEAARIAELQRKEADAEQRAKLETERAEQMRAQQAAQERIEQERQRQRNEQMRAAEAAREAGASDADLARVSGGNKTRARLHTRWICTQWNRNELDLETLRHYLPKPALDSAIKAFIAKGGRELKGAEIVEETTTVVR